MPSDIILIGPTKAGKSTLAAILSERLGVIDALSTKRAGIDSHILNERLAVEGVRYNFDFSAHFIKLSSNYRLAKAIVYTEGKTPEQTADENLALCSS